VARLAGLPQKVITRAREILSNLEINSMSSDGIPSLVKSGANGKKTRETQPELFQHKDNPVTREIQGMDVNDLTPLQALNLINKWKKELDSKK
jgi:DNA mismatch repair protein MutS